MKLFVIIPTYQRKELLNKVLNHLDNQTRSPDEVIVSAPGESHVGPFKPKHFNWRLVGSVAVVSLARPERKNPLTFESYDELRDTFWALKQTRVAKVVVLRGAGGNFCSGGDVHEIIGPLIGLPAPELLMFTRMTGDLVKAIFDTSVTQKSKIPADMFAKLEAAIKDFQAVAPR
jgi:enoyl-CoA hydratase/carnithine racemase